MYMVSLHITLALTLTRQCPSRRRYWRVLLPMRVVYCQGFLHEFHCQGIVHEQIKSPENALPRPATVRV